MAEYPAGQFDGVPKSDVVQIAELEAQVARLEAELRWCIRGLEDAANARPEALVDWVTNLNLERLEYARAALSPDAGKGDVV